MKSINEIIRENNTINMEREQVKANFPDTHKLTNIDARVIFTIEICTRVLIKCYYCFNHYR